MTSCHCRSGGEQLTMLLLGRKPGETVVLELPGGETVKVTIAELDGRRVRVGLDAPASVEVVRGELGSGG